MSDTPYKKSPLFITARFRTGSTMLWNLFRQLPETRTYYEPLHDKIPSFMKYPIRPEKSHLFVKSYFDEYKDAPDAISIHRSDFSNHRLFLESDDSHPDLYAYIQALVESVPSGQTAILQFNRIDFRLAWIKKSFPKARLLHLTRNPRDQWYSTLAPFNIDVNHFIDFDGYDLATWARDLYKQFPFLAAPKIEHAYQRFYFIWKLSYLAGQRLADLSIAYEDILAEPEQHLIQILNFTDLYSDNNLETCLRFVESKPEHAWKKDRSDTWFSDMEQKCEAVLDELGLNANFVLKPLSEIQENSSKYKALLLDPENDSWAIRSFKQALYQDRREIYETHYKYQIALNELSGVQVELSGVQVELSGVQVELSGVQVELSGVQVELDSARLKNNELNQSFHQLWMESDRLRQELHQVYTSNSWRITMPLRKISDLARWSISLLMRFKLGIATHTKAILKKVLVGIIAEMMKHPSLKAKAMRYLTRYPNLKIRIKRLAVASGIVHDSNLISANESQNLTLRAQQIYKDLLDAIEQNKTGR